MDKLEQISFEIISNVGVARSMYIEAIQIAKSGDFNKALDLIREGEEIFANGHKAHAELIAAEAQGEPTKMNLLLTHAEDQLMSAEAFAIIAREFIDVYKTR